MALERAGEKEADVFHSFSGEKEVVHFNLLTAPGGRPCDPPTPRRWAHGGEEVPAKYHSPVGDRWGCPW